MLVLIFLIGIVPPQTSLEKIKINTISVAKVLTVSIPNETLITEPQSPAPPPLEKKVPSRAAPQKRIVSFEVSAYSPTIAECDNDPYTTASGKKVYEGGIAADLSLYPFGTIMLIPNYNNGKPCTVIDCGGAIKGNKLDVFFFSTDKAIHWGRRRNVQVEILYLPKK
jgi:3D (Asp-Asp-Asp) domain-containing protein